MKFLMLGKYTQAAIKGISKARTQKALTAVRKAGGRISSMYALLGAYDLAFFVECPGTREAIKVSVASCFWM